MNTKQDKIELLKAIERGDIDPKTIPANPIVVSDAKEMFIGLMVAAQEDEEPAPVVFVGPAKRALDEFTRDLEP
jgi:hypothetical protein